MRRQVLGEDNEVTYLLFYDFKRYVLEPALRELHDVEWMVSYKPLKEGKKVVAVRFQIPGPLSAETGLLTLPPPAGPAKTATATAAAGSEQQLTLALPADASTLQQRLVKRLLKLKLTKAQAQHVLHYLGDDEARMGRLMKVTHPLLRDFEAGNKTFDNLGGVTINLLKTEFSGLYPITKGGNKGAAD